MTRRISGLILVVLVSFPGFGQKPDQLEFEAASIRPSTGGTPVRLSRGGPVGVGKVRSGGPSGGPGTNDPTTWACENCSLSDLVSLAFGKKSFEVSGPGWLATEKFSVKAKLVPGATKEQFRTMLQNLLVERFKLAVHHETRQVRLYILSVGKNGSKLKESEPNLAVDPPSSETVRTGADGYPVIPRGRGITMAIVNDRARFQIPEETMEKFAAQLSIQLQQPVTDETGLYGTYDVNVNWDPRATPPPDGELGPNLIQAVKEQLGLVLEEKKGPIEVLVIDHAERVPAEN